MNERAIRQDRPLSITMIADILGVSRPTVYRLLRDGELEGRHLKTVIKFVVRQGEYNEQ